MKVYFEKHDDDFGFKNLFYLFSSQFNFVSSPPPEKHKIKKHPQEFFHLRYFFLFYNQATTLVPHKPSRKCLHSLAKYPDAAVVIPSSIHVDLSELKNGKHEPVMTNDIFTPFLRSPRSFPLHF